MPLDRATIDAILADIAAAHAGERQNPPHVLGHNQAAEDANIEALIRRKGGTVMDVQPVDGMLITNHACRIHYRDPAGVEKWAYAISLQGEIDAFLEESLICSAPAYDDPAALTQAIRAARESRRKESTALLDRLDAVDAKWAAAWPSDVGAGPRALARLLESTTCIDYVRQVRADGLEAILTWPEKSLFEINAIKDISRARAQGLPVDESETGRMMTAYIEIYSAAGLL